MGEPENANNHEPIGTNPQFMTKWNVVTRIAFRFACVYFVLYALPSLPFIPLPALLMGPAETWVAVNVFHLRGAVTTRHLTGSGDTTLDYIANLLVFSLAALGAVVWSLADRKRLSYSMAHTWIRLVVRYSLGFTLIGYGFAKVFPNQMPSPSLGSLVQPFGEFSPMGVLWSFMGVSPAYESFSGVAEVLGGALLLFRRTTTLGACVSAGVLVNVVMLNFSYDVPVKLFSSNLLLMAVFLLAPDVGNLFGFFVLNRPAVPVTSEGIWINPPLPARIGMAVFKGLYITAVTSGMLLSNYNQYQQNHDPSARPALYGLYEVESFTVNGRELPPLLTDSQRWRRVVIQNRDYFDLWMMDGSRRTFKASYDGAGTKAVLQGDEYLKREYTLNCSRPDPEHLVMTGTLYGDSLTVGLRKTSVLLENRGFHWIQEFPFNR